MKQEVIYVPVKVEYELPPNNSKVLAGGDYGDYRMTNGFHIKKNNCTHWLKPVQSVYVLTEDKLETFFEMAQQRTGRSTHDFSKASQIIASMITKS